MRMLMQYRLGSLHTDPRQPEIQNAGSRGPNNGPNEPDSWSFRKLDAYLEIEPYRDVLQRPARQQHSTYSTDLVGQRYCGVFALLAAHLPSVVRGHPARPQSPYASLQTSKILHGNVKSFSAGIQKENLRCGGPKKFSASRLRGSHLQAGRTQGRGGGVRLPPNAPHSLPSAPGPRLTSAFGIWDSRDLQDRPLHEGCISGEKLARKEAHTMRWPCHALDSSFSWCCKSQLCMACLSVCLSVCFFCH